MREEAVVRDYKKNGYAVWRDFVPKSELEVLRERAEVLVDEFQPAARPTIFSTHEQTRQSDDYFLESGDKIRFFFEEEAWDEKGQLCVPKSHAINKIGHALHEHDDVFRAFSTHPRLKSLVKALGYKAPLLLQSMYIFKQPGIGGEVMIHQDATFLYTEPVTVMGLWFALEAATRENGCLWVQPEGHKERLRQRFVRDPKATKGTKFIELSSAPLSQESLVPVEVPAGSLVLFHGQLPHYSAANRSSRSRHAYTLHVIEAKSRYPQDNWLQRESPFLALY